MSEVPRELLVDEVMRSLVTKYRSFPQNPQGVYQALLRAVIAQQISNQAARTIRQRVSTRIGGFPTEILRASTEELRACGLSPRKAATIRTIAELESEGILAALTERGLPQLSEALRKIPGVGPWTVEMALVFGLHHPDVWPLSDHGLMSAARSTYGVKSVHDLVRLGERFQPYRTYAAWYLWRVLEN
jgi:DNA-3-methyladenine glycosylase II